MARRALTRAELVRRAAAGSAGLVVAGAGAYGAYSGLEGEGAGATSLVATRRPGTTHAFRSRPDLTPPVVTVVKKAQGTSSGYVFLAPSSGPGQRGPMLVDDAGHVVWFRPTKSTAMNFRAAVYHGKPVLTWWEGKTEHGLGDGVHVIVDGSYREIARFPVGHGLGGDLHEFVLTPSGTALVTAWGLVTRNLLARGGKRRHPVIDGVAQELELPGGRVLFEWRSSDHVGLDESHQKVGPRYDYFHINSIDLAPDGDLIVSARNTWAVYKISRKTGAIAWRLGGKRSDFRMGRGTVFAWQHDARALGDGSRIALFDDGAAPPVEPQSRGLVIALDQARRRATLVHRYTHRPGRLLAHFMGSMQVLPNGNALVGWGSEPYLTEFAEDGTIRFDAKLPRGGQNYRAVRFPWTGRPTDRPRLAARRSSGRTLLYASWNGATELASWQVRTGSQPTALGDAGKLPASGFETTIALEPPARYAAVVALDGSGAPLGTSATLRL